MSTPPSGSPGPEFDPPASVPGYQAGGEPAPSAGPSGPTGNAGTQFPYGPAGPRGPVAEDASYVDTGRPFPDAPNGGAGYTPGAQYPASGPDYPPGGGRYPGVQSPGVQSPGAQYPQGGAQSPQGGAQSPGAQYPQGGAAHPAAGVPYPGVPAPGVPQPAGYPASAGGFPPPAAPERVGLGLGAAALVVVVCCGLTVAIYHWGFIASITAWLMAMGAAWAYTKVGGEPVKGRVPLLVLIVVGIVLGFLSMVASVVWDYYWEEMGSAGTTPEALGLVWENLFNGELWQDLGSDALFYFLFAALGAFGVIRRMSGLGRPRA